MLSFIEGIWSCWGWCIPVKSKTRAVEKVSSTTVVCATWHWKRQFQVQPAARNYHTFLSFLTISNCKVATEPTSLWHVKAEQQDRSAEEVGVAVTAASCEEFVARATKLRIQICYWRKKPHWTLASLQGTDWKQSTIMNIFKIYTPKVHPELKWSLLWKHPCLS